MGKAKAPPTPDPRMIEVLEKQNAQTDELISFVKQGYADNQPRLNELHGLNKQVIQQNLSLSEKAAGRADETYQFYQATGRPAIQRAIGDAMDYDSAGELQRVGNAAGAEAQMRADQAIQQNNRALQRMGVTPNSQRFRDLNNSMALQKASLVASSTTGARENRRAAGLGMRQQSANIANGLPAQSMAQAGQGGAFGASAAGIGASGLQSQMGAQSQMASGMAAGANSYGNVAGTYGNIYGTSMTGYGQKTAADAAVAQGWGNAIGAVAAAVAYADGGVIDDRNSNGRGGLLRGPGTGISDSIAAVNKDTGQRVQLSNGEFIVPADVVKAKGSEFFQKLIDKHHTPAAVQRNLGRQG